jgi:hypothetical protein
VSVSPGRAGARVAFNGNPFPGSPVIAPFSSNGVAITWSLTNPTFWLAQFSADAITWTNEPFLVSGALRGFATSTTNTFHRLWGIDSSGHQITGISNTIFI